MSGPRRRLIALAAAMGAAGLVALVGVMTVDTRRPTPTVADASAPATLRWDALVPPGWDPTQRFRALKLDTLSDADPRAAQLLQDMRATWDNAPLNTALDGRGVRLAGYVVPLEAASGELREFLLVPYYGACIHSPPPPANQVVHVRLVRPLPGLRLMDAVWVSGVLHARRQGSLMGTSGYGLDDGSATPYLGPPGELPGPVPPPAK